MNDGVLVACIGNIFLGDDGFGFEVAQALARCALPPGVEARDYGIRGLDLAYALLGPWKAVVLVDAIRRGGAPGTLYQLQPVKGATEWLALDPHSMDPVRVLGLACSLGDVTAPVRIIGCEPQDFGEESEGRMGLSSAVEAAISEAVAMVLELAEKFLTGAAPEPAAIAGGPS